jgi:hypothetical protein
MNVYDRATTAVDKDDQFEVRRYAKPPLPELTCPGA